MSDRDETPRWDGEPKDILASEEEAAKVLDPTEGESGLDASSENVLDGWPAGHGDRAVTIFLGYG